MKELRSEVIIEAPASRVWDILVDFQSYHEWNPFVHKISGRPALGERIQIWLRTPSGKERNYQPIVAKVVQGHELRWHGKSFLLDGEHIFIVEELDQARTRFIQSEIFRGLLTPFFGESTDRDIVGGFEQMNEALKRRAERAHESDA